MPRQHKVGIIITGDAKGGVRAVDLTQDKLRELNKTSKRVSKESAGAFDKFTASLFSLRGAIAAVSTGAFAVLVKETINAGDQIQKLSIRLGASTEALSEYRLVAERTGVTFNDLATAWQRQTRRISQAAAGTGEAKVEGGAEMPP